MRNFVVEEVKMSNSEGHIFPLQDELNQANNTLLSHFNLTLKSPSTARTKHKLCFTHDGFRIGWTCTQSQNCILIGSDQRCFDWFLSSHPFSDSVVLAHTYPFLFTRV